MDIDRLYNQLLTEGASGHGRDGARAESGEARASSQPPPRAAAQHRSDAERRHLAKDDDSSSERAPFEKLRHASDFDFDDLCGGRSTNCTQEAQEALLKRAPEGRGLLDPRPRSSAEGPANTPGGGGAEWQAEEAGEEGEELLARIDQLYGEIVSDGRTRYGTCSARSAGDGLPVPTGAPASLGPPPAAVVGDAPTEATSAEVASLGDVRELFEEVLWSALLLGRSVRGHADVQGRLLELLPPPTLDASFRACGACVAGGELPASLLTRLAAELPLVSAAMQRCTRGPSAATRGAATRLAGTLRQARDSLLALASSPDPGAEGASLRRPSSAAPAPEPSPQPQQAKRPPKPPRKSAMSHWTPESLSALEAPSSRVKPGSVVP